MFKKVAFAADDGSGNERKMNPRTAGFIVMFFLVAGVLVSAYAIRIDWILHRSKFWPQAEGRVVSAKRIGHDRGLTYTYQYLANGKTETSTNIEPGPDLQHYPLNEGERVLVRHSPGANPYAFLMKPDVKSLILPHVIGFCWLAMGGISLFGLTRGPNTLIKR